MSAPAAHGTSPEDGVAAGGLLAGESTHRGTLFVDARALHASGIGRYLRALLARWLARPAFAQVTLAGDPAALDAFVRSVGARVDVRIVAHHGGFYSLAAQRSWLALRREAASASVAFFPHWDAPVVGMPRRSVVTVHDLIHFRVPDAFGAARRLVAGPVFDQVARRAARVAVVSETTGADLVARLPELASRVRVIPNGVDAPAAAPSSRAVVDGPYLLVVGNQKPHKNLAVAAAALAALRAEMPALRLVAAGRRFGHRSLAADAASLGLAPDAIVEMGEVDDATLGALYAAAAAVLVPSRYEGFGLTALEAMAAGVPVVASSAPALVETVGDAALVVPPDDVAGWASAVSSLLADPALRAEQVRRGHRRVRAFDWDVAAARTADVLREVAAATVGGVGTRK